MVMMMLMSGMRQIQVAFRAAAGAVLHLYRHMLNFIFMFNKMLDAIK